MMQPKFEERKHSVITGCTDLVQVWNLPNLPFTEFFGQYDASFPALNQELLLCPKSGVFQLKYEVEPAFLYHSDNYNFRTLATSKIEKELDFFLRSSLLRSRLNAKSRILEIGGNNSVMADCITGLYSRYVICDPILQDRVEGQVEYWGGIIEDKIDFVEDYQPTVIIGRHVLEHVNSPFTLIEKLLDCIDNAVIFVFEFPNFRLMQQRQRFDAVFHQHLNYFDEFSIQKLIEALGCKILSLENNLEGSNGGSLIVSFTNDLGDPRVGLLETEPFNGSALDNFEESLALFRTQAGLLSETLGSWKGNKFGFGAGLMLATLNYHLNGEVEKLSVIFDDDESKAKTQYQNLNVEIQSANSLVDSESNLILVTSMENQRRVRSRLMDFPKSTIVGFQVG
jgi:hypothetical protein